MSELEVICHPVQLQSKRDQPTSLDKPRSVGETVFRPIHYLGSKLRLLDEIDFFVNKVAPNATTICDLFAGSGTVSQHFISTHNVVSVDIQEYSRVISSAISAPCNSTKISAKEFVAKCQSSQLLDKLKLSSRSLVDFETDALEKSLNNQLNDACHLLEYGSIEIFRSEKECPNKDLERRLNDAIQSLESQFILNSAQSMTLRYFGGVYFSYTQAAIIDSVLEEISFLPTCDKDTFLAALLSSVSEIVNTVGKQFAQPIKPRTSRGEPKAGLKSQLNKDRSLQLFDIYEKWLDKYLKLPKAANNYFSVATDYAEFLESKEYKADIYYADPPYTRDHYSRYYHILETLCLRDNPRISTVKVNGKVSLSRGIYRENRHQSPFCIVSQAPAAFDKLFRNTSSLNAPIIVSYSPFAKDSNNRPRVVGIDTITSIAGKYYSNVEVVSVGSFSHSKLNSSTRNYEKPKEAEVFIICSEAKNQ